MAASAVQQVDHLVYATPDLDAAVADLAPRLGVRASVGGKHIGRGTRNALIAIGPASYLEIVGPDPEQPPPANPRWFGIDGLAESRLVTWAVGRSQLESLVSEAARRGVRLGPVESGGRQRPDGVVLSWKITDPLTVVAEGLVPFFIDWGTSPHPAATAARGPALVNLRGEHPEPRRVRDALLALGLDMPVEPGPRPALVATFQTARGPVELR